MTPCVESQACQKQKAVSVASLIHSIQYLRRNRCTNTMMATGQKISPTWQRNVPMISLIQPSGLPHGVSDHGMKFQSGPVSSTITIINARPLDTLPASEAETLSSPSRFESYQIFSTDTRWVNVLNGEKIMRARKAGNCTPDKVRKRRADVSTGFQSTTNHPSRFNRSANVASSAQ